MDECVMSDGGAGRWGSSKEGAEERRGAKATLTSTLHGLIFGDPAPALGLSQTLLDTAWQEAEGTLKT